MGWITLCVLWICGSWEGNVGLYIWSDWENTFGLSNGFVPGTFLLKPALSNPPLVGIFETNCVWFMGVLLDSWDIIFAAFLGSEGVKVYHAHVHFL